MTYTQAPPPRSQYRGQRLDNYLSIEKLQSDVSFSIEMINSHTAKQILATNTKNRPLNKRNLAKISNALRSGHWKFNGDPIRISQNGELLDGQHRLSAIIQVDTAAPFVVIRGLSKTVFDTIDTNQPRTAADVFAINGEENASSLVSALRFVDLATNDYQTNRYSNIQMQIMLEEHPLIRDSLDYIKGFKYQSLKIPIRILHGYHYLFASKDAALADVFVAKLLTGENVNAEETVYVLRNMIIANASRSLSASYTSKYLAAIICKAWNFTRKGRTIKVLKWQGERDQSLKQEKFPEVY